MNYRSKLENLSQSGRLMFWDCPSLCPSFLLGLYLLLCHWYFSTNWCEYWFSEIYWHFRWQFMQFVFKHLVVSHGSFRTIPLLCTILCSWKMNKVFQFSSISCLHSSWMSTLLKHFGKLSSIACKKMFRMLKLVALWLRVYWNAEVNCIRPVFGSYMSLFYHKFAG